MKEKCTKFFKLARDSNSQAIYFEDVGQNKLKDFFKLLYFLYKYQDIYDIFGQYVEKNEFKSKELIKKLTIGVGVSNLSGVVGIFGQVKSYVNKGILPLLAFAAMLSVNIGIVNLLPIPALDGGKILFVIIEAITRKRIPKKAENSINLVFMGLLLILMLYVTINDIMRI